MSYPNLPDKHRFPSLHRPADFLDAARAAGWDPGPIPRGVVFTFSPLVPAHLAEHPDRFAETPAPGGYSGLTPGVSSASLAPARRSG